MQILVVEDEQRMADLLARTLQEEGHQAVVSGNGREGLAIALSSRFDVIVLDVMLPGMDGFSVVRKLRESRNQTPVLMLTARDCRRRHRQRPRLRRRRLPRQTLPARSSARPPARHQPPR